MGGCSSRCVGSDQWGAQTSAVCSFLAPFYPRFGERGGRLDSGHSLVTLERNKGMNNEMMREGTRVTNA